VVALAGDRVQHAAWTWAMPAAAHAMAAGDAAAAAAAGAAVTGENEKDSVGYAAWTCESSDLCRRP
jgi:hypothetical protein